MKTKDMVLVGTFAALTAIGAFIRVPFFPVPLTLQTFFVFMAGLLLGPNLGALSQLVYVAIGLVGIPVFAGGGGPGYILMPSFGFLIGFIAGAYATGYVFRSWKKPTYLWIITSILAGYIVIYLFGITGLYLNLNYVIRRPVTMMRALQIGMLGFLPGDIVKMAVSAYLTRNLLPRFSRH